MIHFSDNIGPAHPGFPEETGGGPTQRANLQPGIVAVTTTTTTATTSSASFLPTQPQLRFVIAVRCFQILRGIEVRC